MRTSTTKQSIRVGTRGSRLALAQTEWVIERLTAFAVQIEFSPLVITTTGDRSAEPIRGEGLFVKEIQRALVDGEVDIAVHSLKDLPTEPVEGIMVGAIPLRADPREALVGARLDSLAPGARVGTGSPRRTAQLRRLRSDLEVVPIRGNVPTRVEKARAGEVDAVMVAMAGLARLGLEADEIFDTNTVLPAPGQGALAVEVRGGESLIADLVSALDDPATRASVSAEREVLRRLGGGCLLPVAAFGRVEDEVLTLDAVVVSADGTRAARARGRGHPSRPEEVAAEVAAGLVERGALDLL